nr:uncharacterized protein LOC105869150 isoform X2 [Microcebus murinus]
MGSLLPHTTVWWYLKEHSTEALTLPGQTSACWMSRDHPEETQRWCRSHWRPKVHDMFKRNRNRRDWRMYPTHMRLCASTPPTTRSTRSTRRTTVLASATSPVTESLPDDQKFIILGVVVAVLLLLVLTLVLILVLYLRKARARAGKDEEDSHHIYDDLSVQKEETTGFAQQMGSGEDTGNICYASLIHLNHASPEDSIYANTLPNLQPMPDPILSVEYASITRSGPRSSKSAALEEGPGN